MTAIMNGIALHGGHIPFGGTFLVFSDYARNGLRLAALRRRRSIFVSPHGWIGLGEDGPTHQPVEHAATLRLIPNMAVWRPCDQLETAIAWKAAIERRDGPTSLLLTRQNLPAQGGGEARARRAARGGYVLADVPGGRPGVVLIAARPAGALAIKAQHCLSAPALPPPRASTPYPR